MTATEGPVFPNPVFEGSEKRLEVDFRLGTSAEGLRGFSRAHLDELMTMARCCIVSSRSNAHFDAYVLSESSLFVYPTKWVLKTCGTTRLLDSLPRLLELASAAGLEPVRAKFSRATFLFPEQQPFPHTSFDDEVQFLDTHLSGPIGSIGKAYVLGDPYEGLQWHKYVVGLPVAAKATYNLEICMTELDEECARQFFRTEAFVSAAQTTKDTGILALKPNAIIDDYVFEPCGYSMNGIDGTGLITIHITPETGFSYASVEVSGFVEDVSCPNQLLESAIKIFRPGKVAMALSVDNVANGVDLSCQTIAPGGYGCPSATTQKLECGGAVSYYNFVLDQKLARPASPTSIMLHLNSFLSDQTESTSMATAESDGENVSDQDMAQSA